MDRKMILEYRRANAAAVLRENGLRAALICNPRREGMERWLLDEEPLPGVAPFGTLNMILVTDDARVAEFTAAVNHPCDFPHYPLFSAERLEGLIDDRRLGIVNGEFLLESTYEQLMLTCPGLEWVDISAQMYRAKALKSEAEVEAVGRSAALYDRVLAAVPVILRQGVTEMDAVADLRHRLALSGAGVDFLAEDPSLASLVDLTSAPDGGESVTGPIQYPGRRIEWGDRVNLCVRGIMPESCAALGRSFVLGEACEQSKKLWDIAVRAQDMVASLAVPGATLREVNEKVNAYLVGQGCVKDESCWIHGVGCSPCEDPRCVSQGADMILEENMTLVIAPRAGLPGQDPCCCADVFVITPDGGRRLSRTPRILREI